MSKSKSKVKHFYTLKNAAGRDVQIDLNNYKVTCTVTGARKSFYHVYLNRLIHKSYGGNIDTFRTTYVSRAGRPTISKSERLQQRIDRARHKLDLLLRQQADQLEQTLI